jgi:uncharacterized surface protein with fasciclin (FAS1) repeats
MNRTRLNFLRSISFLTVLAGIASTTLLPVKAQTTPSPAATENQLLAPLLQQAAAAGSYTTLARALEAAGLSNQLQTNGGNYTILAPTDAAFASLPQGTLDRLLQPENRPLLQRLLAYHVIPQELTSDQFTTGAVDVLGGTVAVRVTPERIIINNGSVVQPNIQAQNGVVHGISQVLMPRELRDQITSLQ